MAEVALRKVTKEFDMTVAVEDLTMTVPNGAFVVLLGPTGAGKTTTLRLISGLERPDGGDILIDGRSVIDDTPAQRNVAMVFQQYPLYPNMSVRENLAFPLRSPILRTPENEIAARVRKVADVLRIAHKLDNRATALSGGEMQRVSIGRALVRSPAIYLMDEPLSSLDAKLRASLRIELKRIQATLGATMLYVTHDQVEAMTMGTHVGVLDRGRMVQFGPPRAIYEDPVSLYVAGRLGLRRGGDRAGRFLDRARRDGDGRRPAHPRHRPRTPGGAREQSRQRDAAGDGRPRRGALPLADWRASTLDGRPGADDDIARHAGLLGLAAAGHACRRGSTARPRRALGLAGLPCRRRGPRRGAARRADADQADPLPQRRDPRLRRALLPGPDRRRGGPERAGRQIRRRRHGQHAGHRGARLDRRARPTADGGLDAAPPRHWPGAQPDHGGSSGVLLAIFFAAAGDASASGKDATGALRAGLDRIQQVGGARPGDRTMIDALMPALEALPAGLAAAARAARAGADATAAITRARAGRASYLAEASLAGHNDPGAEAVARLFERLAGVEHIPA